MRLVTPSTAYYPGVFTRRTCNEHPCTVAGDHKQVVKFTCIGINCTVRGEGSRNFSPSNIPGHNVTHAITGQSWNLIPGACSLWTLGVNMQLPKTPHMSPSASASITQYSAQSGSPTTAATNPMHPRLVQHCRGHIGPNKRTGKHKQISDEKQVLPNQRARRSGVPC